MIILSLLNSSLEDGIITFAQVSLTINMDFLEVVLSGRIELNISQLFLKKVGTNIIVDKNFKYQINLFLIILSIIMHQEFKESRSIIKLYSKPTGSNKLSDLLLGFLQLPLDLPCSHKLA
jgi:hypothetical protein